MLRHLRWALLWAGVILWLCLIPGRSIPSWNWLALFNPDKLVHASMFFVLSLLLAQAFRSHGAPARYLLWGVLISVMYGIATEFMQELEALGRRLDVNDMIANATGAVGAALYANWREKKGKPIIPLSFLR